MQRVLKFQLQVEDYVSIEMPSRAVILDVAFQHGVLCAWAICKDEDILALRNFRVAGTGHPIDEATLEFVGTARLEALVFHVFEVLE